MKWPIYVEHHKICIIRTKNGKESLVKQLHNLIIIINTLFLKMYLFFLNAQTPKTTSAVSAFLASVLRVCVSLGFALPLVLLQWPENSLISLIIRLTELSAIHGALPRPSLFPFPLIVFRLPDFFYSIFLLFTFPLVYFSPLRPHHRVFLLSAPASTFLTLRPSAISSSVCLPFTLPADFCLWWSSSPSTD